MQKKLLIFRLGAHLPSPSKTTSSETKQESATMDTEETEDSTKSEKTEETKEVESDPESELGETYKVFLTVNKNFSLLRIGSHRCH